MSREQRVESREQRAESGEMSVSALCDEITQAPAYDEEIGLTAERLGRAYERLRTVAVELAEWTLGMKKGGHEG